MLRRALVLLLLAALPIIASGQGGTQGFWTPTNPLPSAHRNHTATALADEKILIAGGLVAAPTQFAPDPVPIAASPNGATQSGNTVTIQTSTPHGLAAGQTVTISGVQLSNYIGTFAVASVVDPTHFTYVIPGTTGLVPSGGGTSQASGTTPAAALYRPEFNDWLEVAPMAGDRYFHAAAPIFGGTAVLVAGGYNITFSGLHASLGEEEGSCGPGPGGGINTAEIFHENTLGWTAAAPMNVARSEFTMVTLFNGMVLAAGSGSAEIYNPASDTWTPTSSMQATRFGAAGALLPDGRVFLAGGDSGGGFLGNFCPADAEVYDPSVDIWFNAGGMRVNHFHGTATLYHLPDGEPRVLVVGGVDGNANPGQAVAISTVESWNPGTNTFIPVPDMIIPRAFHAALVRDDGKVLVTGGINELGDVETRSEVYDPVTNSWSIAAPMIFPHAGHTETHVGFLTGKILVAGGQSGGPVTATAEIFQPTPLASRTSIEALTLPVSNAVSACQPGSLRAFVSSSTGTGVPTGSVNFVENGLFVFTTSLNSGVATFGVGNFAFSVPPGTNSFVAHYFGDSNFLPSDSQTLSVQSVAPPIVVTGPATATAGNQVALTASVPEGAIAPFSFVWTLPSGANVNGNPILVTPAIGQSQYTVNGSDSNGCNLAPGTFTVFGFAQGVLLNSRVGSLSRDAATGDLIVSLVVTNNGTDTASVQVTGSTLNTISTSTALPVSFGNIVGGGGIGAVLLHYPGTAGTPGTTGVLRLNLAFTDLQTATGGTAGGGFRVTIP